MRFKLTQFCSGRSWEIEGLGAVYLDRPNGYIYIVHDTEWFCIHRGVYDIGEKLRKLLIEREKQNLPITDITVAVEDTYSPGARDRRVVDFWTDNARPSIKERTLTEEEKEKIVDFGLF